MVERSNRAALRIASVEATILDLPMLLVRTVAASVVRSRNSYSRKRLDPLIIQKAEMAFDAALQELTAAKLFDQPKPDLVVLPTRKNSSAAFAIRPLVGKSVVAFDRTNVEFMSHEQLKAIARHELGHIQKFHSRDESMSAPLMFLALIAASTAASTVGIGPEMLGVIGLGAVGVVGPVISSNYMNRKRELEADEFAVSVDRGRAFKELLLGQDLLYVKQVERSESKPSLSPGDLTAVERVIRFSNDLINGNGLTPAERLEAMHDRGLIDNASSLEWSAEITRNSTSDEVKRAQNLDAARTTKSSIPLTLHGRLAGAAATASLLASSINTVIGGPGIVESHNATNYDQNRSSVSQIQIESQTSAQDRGLSIGL